jgi:hypothetical protein
VLRFSSARVAWLDLTIARGPAKKGPRKKRAELVIDQVSNHFITFDVGLTT